MGSVSDGLCHGIPSNALALWEGAIWNLTFVASGSHFCELKSQNSLAGERIPVPRSRSAARLRILRAAALPVVFPAPCAVGARGSHVLQLVQPALARRS